MIKRKQLKNIWTGLLLLFLIVSLGYSQYTAGIYNSPDSVFSEQIGKTFFAVFIVGMLLILIATTVLLYMLHKDLDE